MWEFANSPFLMVVIVVAVVLVMILAPARRAGSDLRRTCRTCGAAHPSFAHFCRRCGKRL